MKLLVNCIVFLSLVVLSHSQPFGRVPVVQEKEKIYHEYGILPVDNSDSVDIFILLSFSNDKITFKKNEDMRGNITYSSILSYSAEIRDTFGIIRKTLSLKDTISVATYEIATNTNQFQYRKLQTRIKYSPCTIVTEVTQSNTPIEKHTSEVLKFSKYGNDEIASIPSVIDVSSSAYSVFNGNIPFSSSKFAFVFTAPKSLTPDVWKYAILRYGDNITNAKTQTGFADITAHFINTPELSVGIDAKQKQSTGSLLTVNMESSLLAPGDYLLKLFQFKSTDTLLYKFSVAWRPMPVGLSNARYASEAMYYVLTDSEYENFRNMSDRELAVAINQWWIAKDPTPKTEYNEAMAEYFKRVDIARTEYATLNDADGMKTDRGKVFILNGKPATVVKNVLDGDILQEIWKYNAPQNTTYYFETPRSKQSYKLTKIVN